MKLAKPIPTLCEGRLCSVREICQTHKLEQFALSADYSQVAEFKPTAPRACRMFREIKKV